MTQGVVAPSPADLARRLAHPSIRAPLAIALTNASGLIEWINPAFTRLTGYSADEVIGKDRLDLFRGAVLRTGEIERIRQAMAAGQLIEAEFQTLTRTGQPYWVSCVVAPSVDGDDAGSFVFAEEDITQRRRSDDAARAAVRRAEDLADSLRTEQELLEGVLSTIPHIVYWKDSDNRYLGCNDAFLRLRGLASKDDLAGRTEEELPDGDEFVTAIRSLEREVVADGVPVVDHSIVISEPDAKQQRTMLLSILPRYGEDSRMDGVIGVGADVTRVSELERQLAQGTRLEAVGQLAAGLAHEINTPVQYISDNVLFLADSVGDMLSLVQSIAAAIGAGGATPASSDPEERCRAARALIDGVDLEFLKDEIPSALEQTLEGVGRVGEIVRAMKEFSHPGQGRSDTDLNRAVETTAQVSRSEWKYVAELHLDLDPAVGLVPCYEGELKQVVLNLIVNAAHAVADHRPNALGRIDVATRRGENEVLISVSDNGTGMDEATRERIFDPFFTTKEVGKGTGQGLSMAHNSIVGKHGGAIDVASELGRGTTFTIRLPIVDSTGEVKEGAEDEIW
ncbi:PAS domain-containing sensor histidine kinase [Cryptosporangium aurantiacum]|uniref:histidine kinase n=1 Tax=Cryptosporangium aurantiacum TaxID=134849 RepID=A0A1M7RG22_9ACTN|nr:ATP-binding protein [Cryptosporangium aurantiacum]SHN45190.1 PAS domain S-box-containing protein [Cryptosporangium aurantiacum]